MPNSICINRLREVLVYCESTGELHWKKTLSKRAVAGKTAGFVCKKIGTRLIDIDGKTYTAPKLAWALVHGVWPQHLVISRDGDRKNTAIENLFISPEKCGVLTAEMLREAFEYNSLTGIFVRKQTRGTAMAGSQAGCLMKTGYLGIRIGSKLWLAHRLAWLYVNGKWPGHQIDHINGVRADNRIANLRDATPSLNSQNTRHGRGTTGLLGAHIRDDHFRSSISAGNRRVNLGTFATAEQAHNAYIQAKRQLHAGCTI